MDNIFGTDGIRGRVGCPPMDARSVLGLGKAFGSWLRTRSGISGSSSPVVIIGRDTRYSGDMLAASLAAGLMEAGVHVIDDGILPTPAVALAVRAGHAHAGAVISASHNPYHDNGLKFFGKGGFKLSEKEEREITDRLHTPVETEPYPMGQKLLPVNCISDYMEFVIRSAAGTQASLKDLRLVLDTSNGAMFRAAPAVFQALGAEIHVLGAEPDGYNINEGVGSQHTERLSHRVCEVGAHAGLAFDGDGDRLIAVDASGHKISGDALLAIFARAALEEGTLHPPVLVSTVMSNLGLGQSLAEAGIRHEITGVGDRQVLERMQEHRALIGGEDSGHIIFLGPHCTGDGLFAAVKLAVLCLKTPLEKLASCMNLYPQVLINVPVKEKIPLETLAPVQNEMEAVRRTLGTAGRILVRYSGTESMCRIMVEAPTRDKAETYCRRIQDALQACTG
ncbi:phosphoglucosamine mutase [Desulfobotulus sp. H1]|uniref:Phosphoglucosamine mutase n=1 Tax=Desulfobotulus pelophilus TaxID=2823377 RepID=A0ABT3NCB8_9BACT|nr:phosphoglucosamine mutase [Desulfobotulus pelophilus]MCW7755121.1 phosphoglucosamine mutase [Desulfobotulus pelophilus]